MDKDLNTFYHQEQIGKLTFENGEYIYSYTTGQNDHFLSLTMPVRSKDYVHTKLHPFFEMHLPEGYLLSIIKKHFSKIAKTDDFGVLHLMAPSIKGRITYVDQQQETQKALTLESLLHSNEENLFEELVQKFAFSSPLSGVQPKVLARVEDKATLRFEDYIVKSWGDDYPELALNEFYCMEIVRGADIPVAKYYLSDDEKLFIMKRFDITENGEYLGFEDMCVLQAKQRDDKYEGSYEQIVKTIKTFVSPANKKTALIQFYKMMVINTFVQNGDAHLKNFGLLYDGIQNIKLAPAYDVISTTVYIQNDILALNLMGSKKWWSQKHLEKFGQEVCDLTKKETETYYEECKASALKVLKKIEKRLLDEKEPMKVEILTKMVGIIQKSIVNSE